MKTSRPLRSVRRLAAALGVTALYVTAVASPALADTSQSSAQAAKITLANLNVVDTGTATASNAGPPQARVDNGTSSPLSVLGSQTLVVAGVLPQRAVADPDGTSAACAGAVGPNGTIQIGQSDDCVVTTSPGGVKLLGAVPVLGVGGPALVSADAIYATCKASSTGAPTGTSTLVNATLGGLLTPASGGGLLGGLLGGVLGGVLSGGTPISANPAPNTTLNVLGIVITINKQSLSAGKLTVTALDVDLSPLNLALGHVSLGTVTCGPNAVTEAVPAIPVKGLPIAAGIVVMFLAGTAFVIHRRRATAA